MKTIENLEITKFLDVKTPVGINQKGEDINNYSIGIDLYMPRFNEKFLQGICDVNKKLYPSICYIEDYSTEEIKPEYLKEVKFFNGDELIAKVEYYPESEKSVPQLYNTNGYGKLYIFNMLQIPTGIGINIPNWLWAEIRTKSSNFQNSYTSIHGTVDMNYTYGIGGQIIPGDDIIIRTDEKFAQLVFHVAVPILNITEIKEDDWNKMPDILNKRNKRIGGFGSTGKFDK